MGAGYSSGKGDGPLAELKFGWALRYADSVGWAVKDQAPDLLPRRAARPEAPLPPLPVPPPPALLMPLLHCHVHKQ